MKKRIWNKVVSIFTAILLVVGLVPSTTVAVMAAEEIKLFIGGQQITESGCYENQNGTWTKVDGTEPANGQFSYDADTFTLTLNGATIQEGTSTVSVPYGAGIYAQCNSGESVSLTIELIGENTITGSFGIYVNAEISMDSYGTDASLTITGENNGSLEVSGSNHGIFVNSGTGNASLNIEKATVTSSTNGGYAAGVNVQSSANATGSPNISLAVDGGNLTASGTGSSDGIWFYVGSSQATGATTSLTVSENAIVDARNGGISALKILETLPTPTPTGDNRSGIVFDDKNGTVYGDVTLQEDLEIGEGESLTIGDGASLTVPDGKTLTNNGTVTVEEGGTLTNNGSLDCNHHTGGTATCTEKAKCDLCGAEYGDFLPHSLTKTEAKAPTCTVVGNEAYWTCGNCGKYFSDANGDTEIAKDSWIISAINHDWNDAVYTWSDDGSTCTATRTCKHDSAHTETSKATVTGAQTKAPTCTEKGETTYTATFEADWAVTQTKVLADISATGHSYGEPVWSWSEDGKTCTVTFTCEKDETHKETPKVIVTSAEKTPGTCTETGVTTYTATVEFNGKTHTYTKDVADIPAIGHKLTKTEAKAPTSTDTGNIEYWYCEVCNKYFSDEKVEHEITLEDTIIAKLPKLISGANQEWTKGSKEGLTFKIDTDINEFKKVLVDGKELKDTNYDIKSGSTILTLKPSFLDTLSAGKHKIRFEFNTGSVEAYFTVKDKENSSQTESANTGVQNKYGLWIVLLLVAAGGLAGFGILSKRRKNHK